MKFKVVIHKADEGGFWAEVPGFPGCVSEGETLEEVRANIRDAFTGVLEVMQERPIEEPTREPDDLVEVLEA
jgi:predicted RNase H-like HicB family nuclease